MLNWPGLIEIIKETHFEDWKDKSGYDYFGVVKHVVYTDKNYGDVLSIWDRGFGTFARLSKGNVVFGVDTHSQENKINTFGKLLKLPLLQIKKMQTDKRIYSNEQKDLIDV
jgi:hypothetical protein